MSVVSIYCIFGSAEEAERIGRTVVEEGLAACINILAPCRSIYRWQGAVDRADETPMLLKTTSERAERLRDLIVSRHPYDVPCVLALPVSTASSNSEFLQWIAAETGSPAGDS